MTRLERDLRLTSVRPTLLHQHAQGSAPALPRMSTEITRQAMAHQLGAAPDPDHGKRDYKRRKHELTRVEESIAHSLRGGLRRAGTEGPPPVKR